MVLPIMPKMTSAAGAAAWAQAHGAEIMDQKVDEYMAFFRFKVPKVIARSYQDGYSLCQMVVTKNRTVWHKIDKIKSDGLRIAARTAYFVLPFLLLGGVGIFLVPLFDWALVGGTDSYCEVETRYSPAFDSYGDAEKNARWNPY